MHTELWRIRNGRGKLCMYEIHLFDIAGWRTCGLVAWLPPSLLRTLAAKATDHSVLRSRISLSRTRNSIFFLCRSLSFSGIVFLMFQLSVSLARRLLDRTATSSSFDWNNLIKRFGFDKIMRFFGADCGVRRPYFMPEPKTYELAYEHEHTYSPTQETQGYECIEQIDGNWILCSASLTINFSSV